MKTHENHLATKTNWLWYATHWGAPNRKTANLCLMINLSICVLARFPKLGIYRNNWISGCTTIKSGCPLDSFLKLQLSPMAFRLVAAFGLQASLPSSLVPFQWGGWRFDACWLKRFSFRSCTKDYKSQFFVEQTNQNWWTKWNSETHLDSWCACCRSFGCCVTAFTILDWNFPKRMPSDILWILWLWITATTYQSPASN